MLRPLGGTGWMFLRYFVVARPARPGAGRDHVGTADRLAADAGYTLLVLDVEDPDEPGCDPAEVQIRNRRIRFYQRHGAAACCR